MTELGNLSPTDFEGLCRDLAGAVTGKRFEAFGPGPDGGVDGRHSISGKTTILQCKHYLNSTFSNLKRSVRSEVEKVSKLNPSKYILFTSSSLTPERKNQLLEVLDVLPVTSGDIYGQGDIHDLLRKYPEVYKAHIKLWLSSAAALERILQSGLESFTNTTREEIRKNLRVYVPNESFSEAITKLEKQKVLIVSGTPGVGKTTLAQMLTYRYLDSGWQFYSINSLEDGFGKIDDGRPTVFFFDDFLGRIELNRLLLYQHDSLLASFVNRIQSSKNARFILTTRAHIFEEARSISDYIDEPNVQLAKYILDVGKYTRRIKAHIFFNHLSNSDLTEEHFSALLATCVVKKIVDHGNYNPRIVSHVTNINAVKLARIEPAEFPDYILSMLNEPDLIWKKPYQTLSTKSQHLLITLYFCDQAGGHIDELRASYNALNGVLCRKHEQPYSYSDFEDALAYLESGFISISGQIVAFVNPSVRDFLNSYLIDPELLRLLPKASVRAHWARRLWRHGKKVLGGRCIDLNAFATAFFEASELYEPNKIIAQNDLRLAERLDLLYEMGFECDEPKFLEFALFLLNSEILQIAPSVDAKTGIELLRKIRFSLCTDSPFFEPLINGIEQMITSAICDKLDAEHLLVVIKTAKRCFENGPPEGVQAAIDSCVCLEANRMDFEGFDLSDKQTLSEHLFLLDELEELTGCDASLAKEAIHEALIRIPELEYDKWEYSNFFDPRAAAETEFSDDDLNSLFATLLSE